MRFVSVFSNLVNVSPQICQNLFLTCENIVVTCPRRAIKTIALLLGIILKAPTPETKIGILIFVMEELYSSIR